MCSSVISKVLACFGIFSAKVFVVWGLVGCWWFSAEDWFLCLIVCKFEQKSLDAGGFGGILMYLAQTWFFSSSELTINRSLFWILYVRFGAPQNFYHNHFPWSLGWWDPEFDAKMRFYLSWKQRGAKAWNSCHIRWLWERKRRARIIFISLCLRITYACELWCWLVWSQFWARKGWAFYREPFEAK